MVPLNYRIAEDAYTEEEIKLRVESRKILELPGFAGNEIELTWVDDEYTFTVDGSDRSDPPDPLFALCDGDFELAASRIDDTLFEATVTPL